MTNWKSNNTNPATVDKFGKLYMPIKMPVSINFNAPVTVNLTYNGGANEKPDFETIPGLDKPASDTTAAPTETRTTNVPTDKPGNIPEEWKYVETKYGVTEAQPENEIFDEIVRRFKVKRDTLISITPFISAYEMYAVGTKGDVTFLAWRHPSGQLFIQQQCW